MIWTNTEYNITSLLNSLNKHLDVNEEYHVEEVVTIEYHVGLVHDHTNDCDEQINVHCSLQFLGSWHLLVDGLELPVDFSLG
jgi:hypothetical protein